jgi:hypothetical protein
MERPWRHVADAVEARRRVLKSMMNELMGCYAMLLLKMLLKEYLKDATKIYTNNARYEVKTLVLTIDVHAIEKVKKSSTESTWWRYYKMTDRRYLMRKSDKKQQDRTREKDDRQTAKDERSMKEGPA